uniref:Uncharacterized protein n=1 Tax=Panagrellus redivivus TaxID=6233 RepID=A0A7E4UNP0_PANRE
MLTSKSSESVVRKGSSYPAVRNRLAEQNARPMNQTYTIGTNRSYYTSPSAQKQRERSCSIDSDIAEYTINGALSGLFPRAFNKSHGSLTSASPAAAATRRAPSTNTLQRVHSTKLPSLEGCSPERKCCQKPFGRAALDLAKYKETLLKHR